MSIRAWLVLAAAAILLVVLGFAPILVFDGMGEDSSPGSSAPKPAGIDEELGIVRVLDPTDGTVLWTVQPDSKIVPTAGILNDVAVVGTTTAVIAYEIATGVQRWRYPLTTSGFLYEPPRAFSGVVVATDNTGNQTSWVGIDATTGVERWRYRPGGEVGFGTVATTELVYLNAISQVSRDRSLVALELATGAARWTMPLGRLAVGAFLLAGDILAAPGWDGQIRGFDSATGEPRWTIILPQVHGLTAARGQFYATTFAFENGATQMTLQAIDPASGAIIWSYPLATEIPALPTYPFPAVVDRAIIVSDSKTSFAALDPASGAVKWTHPADGLHVPSAYFVVAGAGDRFYTSDHLRVQQRSAATGEITWEQPLWTAGTILVSNAEGGTLVVTTHGEPDPVRD